MKNKKLFAILTLVCFMFTLMPVAAFAAPEDYVVKVKVGNETYTEDVYVTAGTTVSALAFDGSTPLAAGAYYALDANGKAVALVYDADGDGEIFTLKTPGTYTIYAVEPAAKGAGTAANLKSLVEAANNLLTSETVATAVTKIQNNLDAQIIKSAAYVTVEAPDANQVIALFAADGVTPITEITNLAADGGFKGNAQVVVKLTNNTKPIVGKTPTIVAPEYLTVVPADAKKTVTDAAGKIKYNISANRAGNFEVVFGYDEASDKSLKVKAVDGKIANIEVVKEATNSINKHPNAGTFNTGATVKFTEANGSVKSITGDAAAGIIADVVKVAVVSQPTGSKLAANDFSLVANKQNAAHSDLVLKNRTSDLKIGAYKVKLSLENGKSVTVAFEVAKKGDTVGIRFVQPPTTIALGDKAPDFTVQAYDANGVTETANVTLNFNGKAWNGTNVFVDDKYIGSTITVLAKTTDDKFVATTTLEVVDTGNKVVYANTTAEVGVTTTLKASVVDAKGNKVLNPATSATVVVLEKPAKAYVYADASNISTSAKEFNVSFVGSVAGEYKIQTIFVKQDGTFVSGIETITVGANAATSTFSDVIVMSIGANKMIKNSEIVELLCAPVIKDSRTFVPFRSALEAFGATVDYIPETGEVIAEMNGVKVVMMNGEKAYTVNGVAKTADVAPYLNTEVSTTMVPVSFIVKEFGIKYQCIYNADGTVADILFTK